MTMPDNSLDAGQQTLLRYFIRHLLTISQNSRHRLPAVLVLEILDHLVLAFVAATPPTSRCEYQHCTLQCKRQGGIKVVLQLQEIYHWFTVVSDCISHIRGDSTNYSQRNQRFLAAHKRPLTQCHKILNIERRNASNDSFSTVKNQYMLNLHLAA